MSDHPGVPRRWRDALDDLRRAVGPMVFGHGVVVHDRRLYSHTADTRGSGSSHSIDFRKPDGLSKHQHRETVVLHSTGTAGSR